MMERYTSTRRHVIAASNGARYAPRRGLDAEAKFGLDATSRKQASEPRSETDSARYGPTVSEVFNRASNRFSKGQTRRHVTDRGREDTYEALRGP